MSPFVRLTGKWRAVPVLGITQILAWGALFYPPVLTVPLIADDRGWSLTFTMGGFSFGLLVGGIVSPLVGSMIDRYGGHRVMPIGSLAGALGLIALVHASDPVAYLATWALLGAAMAASLYDPAFASLGRIFGLQARRSITLLTFIAGFASTVSWPVTHVLLQAHGWRTTYLIYAALLALIAAPLHAFLLPRERAEPEWQSPSDMSPPRQVFLPSKGAAFVFVAAAFAAYAFVPSALSAHMLAMFARLGIDANAVIWIGALFGPAQVVARFGEFAFAKTIHPLTIARFAVALLLAAFLILAVGGAATLTAAAFAVLFGVTNGLMTIARGTVPLALFGAEGFGRLIGRIAGPSLVMQAAAPLVVAFIAERASDPMALAAVAVSAAVALAGLFAVHRPHA